MGADTADGGELVRILAMHPDVEIIGIQARGLDGMPVTARHHGLIGETTLSFTPSLDYSRLDILFISSPISLSQAELIQMRMTRPDLKVIMFDAPADLDYDRDGFVYGLPEINRKSLVRGATGAVVPSSFASMALVALYPFAMRLLLNGDIDIRLAAPRAIIDHADMSRVEKEIESRLGEAQRSFSGKVRIHAEPSSARRSGLMKIEFGCSLSLEQMLSLYDMYDDHRFAFVTTVPVGVSEVAGTNKCVVIVSKGDEGRVSLGVAADCRMRGGAGEATHIMNLLCGLHERTGLALKAIDFEPVD